MYQEAIDLLKKVSTKSGFLASAENTSNYQRVWARDGVICGLAAIASGDEKLIETFRNTLKTLADFQHKNGTIPSNVSISNDKNQVSYGGLAGRVDAVTWYIIGVCQYVLYTKDKVFFKNLKPSIEKCLSLLEAWEFNNKHLLYVPLSGNWADEYITDGYVFYDQLLRIWALKLYNQLNYTDEVNLKINNIVKQIETNFLPNSKDEKYHERAYKDLKFNDYLPCSFSPSGYKIQFDAFANSLVIMLNLFSEEIHNNIINYSLDLINTTKLKLLPAFWPPIFPEDVEWSLLKNNCKFEFRNNPYEFHNGGSWPMVNGFFGLALINKKKSVEAQILLSSINNANSIDDNSFFENFNTNTTVPNGVAFCSWSAAATILVHQSLNNNFKLFI